MKLKVIKVEAKSNKYTPKTIYLDKENLEKLEEIVNYTGLNPSQIFRRVIPNIKKEDVETKEEKFKRLSKSGRGKLIEKPDNYETVHLKELAGCITDAKPIDSVRATRQIRKGDYR